MAGGTPRYLEDPHPVEQKRVRSRAQGWAFCAVGTRPWQRSEGEGEPLKCCRKNVQHTDCQIFVWAYRIFAQGKYFREPSKVRRSILSADYQHFESRSMQKTKALEEVAQLLEQQVQQLVQAGEENPASVELGAYQEMWAEVAAHQQVLTEADLICEMAQQGEVPPGWDEHSGGAVFNYHAAVGAALSQLPGGGQFSPALGAYFDELPAQMHRAHEEVMAWLRTEDSRTAEDRALPNSSLLDYLNGLAGQPTHALKTTLAHLQADDSTPVVDPIAQLTEQQAGQYGPHIQARWALVVGALTEGYAADVACAIDLCQQRGDWTAIRDCLK